MGQACAAVIAVDIVLLPVSCMLHCGPMLQAATACVSQLSLLLAPCEKSHCNLQSQPHDKTYTLVVLKSHAQNILQLATEM